MKRGRKGGPDLSALIDTSIVGLFGLVAVATGHEHWLKERGDVLPMTGPLNAWIDQLPSKTLKRIEKNLAPCLFVTGCAVVAGPDIVAEMRLRAQHKSYVAAVSQPRQSRSAGVDRFAGVPIPTSNGASADQSSAGEWAASVPAIAHEPGEWNVG